MQRVLSALLVIGLIAVIVTMIGLCVGCG